MATPRPIQFDTGHYETSYSAVPRGHDNEPNWDHWQKTMAFDERRTNDFSAYSSQPDQQGGTRVEYVGGPMEYQYGKDSSTMEGTYSDAPAPGPKGGLKKVKPGFETILADIWSVGLPLGLLAFAIATLIRDQDEGSEDAIEKWRNAASVLSTLFPVLFAAIVGRLMMHAARWKLEEGSTLGSLEQLLGSRTVGGAILTPFHLRSLNFLGVGLLLLWAFSPLGAQATLRMVELRVAPRTEPSSALYFDTRSTSRFQDLTAVSPSTALLVEVVMDQIATIYNGLLLAPMAIKNDTMDLWGNVKVPLFSSLERRTETEGWTDVPNGDIQYSGLVGIPVVNITTGNTTFELESNYLELVCERVKKYEDKTDMPKLNETALLRWPITTEMPIRNGTFQGWPVDREVGDVSRAPWSIGVDRLVDKDWARGEFINAADDPTGELRRRKTNSLSLFQDEENIEAGPTRLLFASTVAAQITGYREHVATYCNISQHYVESNITCQKPNPSDRETCHVTAQRPSQRPHPSEHINSLNFPILLNAVSRYLPLATGNNVGDMSNADLTLQFLADPALANISTPSRQPLQLADLDAETFSRRLTQVLNSYIHLGQMYTNALGNIGRDGSLLYQNTTVPTRVTNIVHVYQVPKIWAALSIVSCVVMLAGGTASVVFAHLAVGPEVLGFASTAVRDNKYMALPSETANMEGTDISVRLRDRRVRFGVTQEEDIDGMGVGFQEKVVRIKDAVKMSQG